MVVRSKGGSVSFRVEIGGSGDFLHKYATIYPYNRNIQPEGLTSAAGLECIPTGNSGVYRNVLGEESWYRQVPLGE
jgi:hypothetical protein